MRSIKIASRASKLALAQTDIVTGLLKKLYPELEISVVTISTKGDRDKSDFLYKSELRGLFTSELEKAVLAHRADIAVHSLKDLPTADTDGLIVAAIPKRGIVADALVTSEHIACLGDLPAHSTVGTSSLRRVAQLRYLRPDLKTVPLRGNIDTRVNKVVCGLLDAVVVACAGLNRLGLADKISVVLPPEEFLTAAGQGALAVQIRADDAELQELVSQLDDRSTRITTQAERAVLAAMYGGCSIPVGVYARILGDQLVIDAMIAQLDGKNLIRCSRSSPVSQAQICTEKIAEELLAAGGKEILEQFGRTAKD